MGYERYPRGTNPQGGYYGRNETQDYGRDYGSGRNYSYSSARDYRAAGAFDRDRNDDNRYGGNDDRQNEGRYGNPSAWRDEQRGEQGTSRYRGRDDYRRGGSYGGNYDGGEGYSQSRYARGDEYHGSYASDGHRFEDVGRYRHQDDDNYRGRYAPQNNDRYRNQPTGRRDDGRSAQGYDYDDRGFLARAGDEVRSWFGDEDAERRREMDSRYDERYYNQQGGNRHDDDYRAWRSGQIAGLDRDYDEYRQENRSRFENEFSSWRTQRQTQRASLNDVKEHAEVLGSDGSHVGTVDKVRGDRILLTKNDADAGGQHHSIPSRWIDKVEDNKVTLSKTADEAKQHWRNEENSQAMFGDRAQHNDRGYSQSSTSGTSYGQSPTASSYGQSGKATTGTAGSTGTDTGGTNLNKSFSGTY